MIPDRSSPSRVRFAASRPGLLRADPKGMAVYEGKGGGWSWLLGCGPCERAEREPFDHTRRRGKLGRLREHVTQDDPERKAADGALRGRKPGILAHWLTWIERSDHGRTWARQRAFVTGLQFFCWRPGGISCTTDRRCLPARAGRRARTASRLPPRVRPWLGP